MYRVLIIILVMLLSGCGTGKEKIKETGTERIADTSSTAETDRNLSGTDLNQSGEESRETEVVPESPEDKMTVELRESQDAGSESVVMESTDNEFNRFAAAAYREILQTNFSEGGYYCVVDVDGDNVYEMAAASNLPDENGKYLSMVAYVDKGNKEVEYTVLDTEQAVGFDIGYGDEKGKLLVRTGKDSVHHYAFSVKNDSLEKTDFLVLDSIMDSVDKTKDPENYRKYLNQDRGEFNELLMWTVTEEHLGRDLSECVAASPTYIDAIDAYFREQPKGSLYGFYNTEIEEVFSMDFSEIEKRFGLPAARMLFCSLKKDPSSGNKYLQYDESFLWCSEGTGFFVSENDIIEGTLETFFDVRQETLTFKELQDTLGVQFYHEVLTPDYDIVFVYYGHTFYVEAQNMAEGLIRREAHVKALKNAVDTGNFPLLFDADGNITVNHG